MAAFHQIGHDSANMLFEPQLGQFRGAILSPVNYGPDSTDLLVRRAREELRGFSLWFDPQLYVPESTRGQLPTWPYLPGDFDSADPMERGWWERTISQPLLQTCQAFRPDAICSPVALPKNFTNNYYTTSVAVANDLAARAAVPVTQTVIVSGVDLLLPNRPMEIASIVSRTDADWIYLLVNNEKHPRREYDQSLEIEAILRLIAALKEADLKVMVGYCSSDMVLWKAAGADSVASGKFFNLRRFSRVRFDEPTDKGKQLPYWFEESLMAFLREDDLARLDREKLLGDASGMNPICEEIMQRKPGEAWLRLSWRQYLWWFANCEAQLDGGATTAEELLAQADERWPVVREKVLMVERENTGAWITAWRAALQAFRR
jgi:hypothetical protein